MEERIRTLRFYMAGTVGISWALFQIYAAWDILLDTMILRGAHVGFALALAFLLKPSSKSRPIPSFIVDTGLAFLGVLVGLHVVLDYQRLVERIISVDPMTRQDIVLGTIAVLLILEATRRAVMPALAVISGIFIVYALTGPYLMIGLRHSAASFEEWVEYLYLTTDGIFGVPTGVSATYVFLFILFVAFLKSTNIGQFYMDLAFSLTGKTRGGAAKASVVASSFFGTISGSAVANTVGTGSFTIPLIIKSGYKPRFAAAVEALSSTGGQIMPPIMGAAAFIMAELTGISYWNICKAAAFPALLFYGSIFIMLHLEAVKLDLKGIDSEDLPNLRETLKRDGVLMVPVIVLVGCLALDYTITRAAVFAIFSVMGVFVVNRQGLRFVRAIASASKTSSRDGFAVLVKELRVVITQLGKTLNNGAEMAVTVAIACICSGIIVGVISLSGLGLRFASMVEVLSGGYTFLALVLVALASIIMGMGMPTTAAYIMVSTLSVPALIALDVSLISAHMFAFYFACLSMITPPVALCAYAAAGIAGAKPMEVGLSAMRLGIVAFIIPFMFVYNPAIILIGPWTEVILSVVTSLIGITALSGAVVGFIFKPATVTERVLLGLAALTLIFPGYKSDLVGLPILVGIAAWNYRGLLKIRTLENQGVGAEISP
jgi:TRAP transporter 4TM/12TM fusion protein